MRDLFAGRRSFLIVAATSALVVLLGNPLAEWLGLAHWSRRDDERKLTHLARSGLAAEVLLLGSSRMKFGVTPVELEDRLSRAVGRPVRVFNAAQAATGVMEASWFLGDVVRSNGCPRLVVVDVNAEGLNAASARIEESLRLYLPPREWGRSLTGLDGPSRVEAFLTGLATGYRHLLHAVDEPPSAAGARREAREVLACRGGVVGPDGRPCVATGGAGGPTDRRMGSTLAQETALSRRRMTRWYEQRARRFHRLGEFEPGGLPEKGLDRLVELGAHCAADLVLITLPTLYPWAEWGLDGALATTSERARRAAAAAGGLYLDYSPLVEELAPRDFYDPGHLSASGARHVTRDLAARVASRLRP